jgi:hypothetical protein
LPRSISHIQRYCLQAVIEHELKTQTKPLLALMVCPYFSLTLLGCAGTNFIMGVPGADDIMLNYQSTSFHDANYLRQILGLKRSPEFATWLREMSLCDNKGRLLPINKNTPLLGCLKEFDS